MPFRANPSAVKQPSLVEKVGAFKEKGTVLVKSNLVGAEVQHQVVRHHLPKIRNQGHVHGEGVADAHFGVESAIDRCGPFSRSIFIHSCGRISAHVGKQGNAWRGVDPLDAAKHATLVDHAVHGGIQGIPDRLFTRTPHVAPNVHAPFLFHTFWKRGHPELTPRHANFGGPASGVDLALNFPNAIPRIVRALSIHDEVVQRASRGRAEAHRIDAVVVRAEPNAKFVGVVHSVAHAQLLQNGIRCRVVHLGPDVEVVIVVGNPNLCAVGGRASGEGAVLGELCGAGIRAPCHIVQSAIDGGWRVNPIRHGNLVTQIECDLSVAIEGTPTQQE